MDTFLPNFSQFQVATVLWMFCSKFYASNNQIINITATQRKNLDNTCSSAYCGVPALAEKNK